MNLLFLCMFASRKGTYRRFLCQMNFGNLCIFKFRASIGEQFFTPFLLKPPRNGYYEKDLKILRFGLDNRRDCLLLSMDLVTGRLAKNTTFCIARLLQAWFVIWPWRFFSSVFIRHILPALKSLIFC